MTIPSPYQPDTVHSGISIPSSAVIVKVCDSRFFSSNQTAKLCHFMCMHVHNSNACPQTYLSHHYIKRANFRSLLFQPALSSYCLSHHLTNSLLVSLVRKAYPVYVTNEPSFLYLVSMHGENGFLSMEFN